MQELNPFLLSPLLHSEEGATSCLEAIAHALQNKTNKKGKIIKEKGGKEEKPEREIFHPDDKRLRYGYTPYLQSTGGSLAAIMALNAGLNRDRNVG